MLRVGVIGCGYWGKNYVRVLEELPETKLMGIADKVPANLEAISRKFPFVNVHPDHTALINNPEVDACIIATTASTHFEIAKDAIARGKHLLIEKPLALETDECEELTRLAEAAGTILIVGHTFLYNDAIRKMKELLQEKESGKVYYLTARRNHLGTIREDVSALWDLAAHDVAIFSYLMDADPISVSAVGGYYLREDREDVCFISLRYPNNVIGHIEVSWVDANKIREVVAITGKRRIVFDDLNNLEVVKVFEKGISLDQGVESFGEFQYLLRDGNIFSPKIDRREPLKTQCLHLVACIEGKEKPLTPGQSGTMNIRTLQAAVKSMAQNGNEVKI
jgi:predicted dehydrogenase